MSGGEYVLSLEQLGLGWESMIADNDWERESARETWIRALAAHDARIASEAGERALRDAAEDLDGVYFGPDQDTPFSTGAKHKWGAIQSAKRLRERADRLRDEREGAGDE